MTKKWIRCLPCLWLMGSSIGLSAEAITIAIPETPVRPYSFGPADRDLGIYVEVLTEVFKRTPYDLKFLRLPPPRIRLLFSQGQLDAECCPIPPWREEERAISIYTDDMFSTEDMLVFPKGEVPHLASLRGMRVGTVRGYGYRDDNAFARVDMDSEANILQVLAKRRIDVGLSDRRIAIYLIRQYGLDVEIGQVHEAVRRPLRLHKDKRHLIGVLNKAIAAAKEEGAIDRILQRYR